MSVRAASSVLAACLLTSCSAPPPPNPAELVPADVIINTIKCEVAQLVTDFSIQTPRRIVLLGQDFAVNLKLKAVIKTSAGIDADGPLSILAYNGTIPTLTLGASTVASSTVDTTTDFTLSGSATDVSTCLRAKETRRILANGIGYYVYMRQLANDVNNFVVGDPKIIADQFKYDVTFGVTQNVSGSLKYGFVPLSVKGSAGFTNDSVQQVVITVRNHKGSGASGATPQATGSSASRGAPDQRCLGLRCLPPAIPLIRQPDAPLQ